MMLSKRDHHLRLSVESLLGCLDSVALIGRSQSPALVPFDDVPELRPLRSMARFAPLFTEFRLEVPRLRRWLERELPGGTSTR